MPPTESVKIPNQLTKLMPKNKEQPLYVAAVLLMRLIYNFHIIASYTSRHVLHLYLVPAILDFGISVDFSRQNLSHKRGTGRRAFADIQKSNGCFFNSHTRRVKRNRRFSCSCS